MASAFKNAGQANPTADDATANVYTAPSNGTAVLHAVYISNTSQSTQANVDVKVTIDGGTTFRHIIKNCIIPQNNTFILDKPVNLEANDIIRVVSNITGTDTFISVLENT
tara:strand:+ start:72 stop:401 length:330 start_codon:yes stop_codon:yes gene_type:complete